MSQNEQEKSKMESTLDPHFQSNDAAELKSWQRKGAIFGLDIRALAAMRISMGLLLLMDLFIRVQDLVAHYTDAGVLSRSQRILLYDLEEFGGVNYWFSFHMLSGSVWLQATLFGVAAFFALWMTIGYRTRIATFISWVLLMSLHARNPMVLQGGDTLLRCMLFWCMFVPWGAAWSVDQLLSPSKTKRPQRIVSFGTFAIMAQLCFMYWFTAVLKNHPVWRTEFTSVYYTLHIDHFSTPFGTWLLQFPWLLKCFSFGTIVLEFVGPLLVFSPLATQRVRGIVCFMFISLHVGLAATLELGLFPIICIVCWVGLLPTIFWDRTVLFVRNRLKLKRSINAIATGFSKLKWIFRKPAETRFHTSPYAVAIGGLLLAFVFAMNTQRNASRQPEYSEPSIYHLLGGITGLDQTWAMFSPRPPDYGGWYTFEGTLVNGKRVNLWQPDLSVPKSKPAVVSSMYSSQRWRKLLINLGERNIRRHQIGVARYFVNRWNKTHDPEQQVATIQVVMYYKYTSLPGGEEHQTQSLLLLRGQFDSERDLKLTVN